MAVYFIRDSRGCVKIGVAIDPWSRLQALQCASSDRLALIRVVDGGQKVEAWFHKRFATYRVRGEWFEFCDAMLTTAAPDELPPPPRPAPPPRMSVGEYIREADRLGLVTGRMREEWAPFLDERPAQQ